jgi:type II secretory pathway pseudopilin PulG
MKMSVRAVVAIIGLLLLIVGLVIFNAIQERLLGATSSFLGILILFISWLMAKKDKKKRTPMFKP